MVVCYSRRKMAWTIWCFDRLEKLCKDTKMQSFNLMKSMLREGENIYHSHMHDVPKYIKLININHAISLFQMQGCPQSNIKQEIKSFCFKNFTKINNELS